MNTQTAERPQQFPQTSWTLLMDARGDHEAALQARQAFVSRYYEPIYAYTAAIRRSDDPDKIEDLVTGFIETRLLSGKLLHWVDRAEGSFRIYLKQALRHYLIDAWRQQQRRLREGSELHPDAWSRGWAVIDQVDEQTPDAAFHTAWVRALLKAVLDEVQQICEEKEQTLHWALFEGFYLNGISWETLGEPHGMSGKTARERAQTAARHFRKALRNTLIAELGSEQAADEEIDTLLAFL